MQISQIIGQRDGYVRGCDDDGQAVEEFAVSDRIGSGADVSAIVVDCVSASIGDGGGVGEFVVSAGKGISNGNANELSGDEFSALDGTDSCSKTIEDCAVGGADVMVEVVAEIEVDVAFEYTLFLILAVARVFGRFWSIAIASSRASFVVFFNRLRNFAFSALCFFSLSA